MGKTLSFLIGVLMGAMVGWVLGTLFAPCTGQETRDSLADRAIELKGRAEKAADQIVTSVREQSAGLRDDDLELRRGVQA